MKQFSKMFLCGCSDHPNQLFRHKQKSLLVNRVTVQKTFFRWGWESIACRSVARRGQEMFCGCSRFRIV